MVKSVLVVILYESGFPMPRILIADDDELIASLASDILIDAGFACGWVPSAEACLQVMRFKRPDLLLLDYTFPGMSGITMLRQLRRSREFYDLPVIMVTAVSGTEDEAQAIYAGAQDFIRKPFDPVWLVRKVVRQLEKRSGRPRHVDLAAAIMGMEIPHPSMTLPSKSVL
jgi:two-component system, OmpR family, phosphate regulon response regulator PhoB